jgi:hypothetical protein
VICLFYTTPTCEPAVRGDMVLHTLTLHPQQSLSHTASADTDLVLHTISVHQ